MLQRHSGGHELGECVSTARSRKAKCGSFPELHLNQSHKTNVSSTLSSFRSSSASSTVYLLICDAQGHGQQLTLQTDMGGGVLIGARDAARQRLVNIFFHTHCTICKTPIQYAIMCNDCAMCHTQPVCGLTARENPHDYGSADQEHCHRCHMTHVT